MNRRLLRVRPRDWHRFVLFGLIGTAGSNFTYYFTINVTNVATAILLQYLAPILVLGYAVASKDERVDGLKLTAGLVSIGGCFLAVAGKDFSLLNINRIGLLTGLASAFCWGFANIYLKRLLRDYSAWTCLVYSFLVGSIFWMFINPPWKILNAGYTAQTWEMFFGFALISILIPHSLYYSGVRYLTASRAIITATSEPIFAILFAFLIIGEVLSSLQMVGAILVIAAIGVLQFRQETQPEVATPEAAE